MSKYKITSSRKNKNLIDDIIELERMKITNPDIKKEKENKKPKKLNNDPYVRRSELKAELKPIKEKMETMVTHEELQAELKPIKESIVTHEELNKMEERINKRFDDRISNLERRIDSLENLIRRYFENK